MITHNYNEYSSRRHGLAAMLQRAAFKRELQEAMEAKIASDKLNKVQEQNYLKLRKKRF